jgi:hypothetical protein
MSGQLNSTAAESADSVAQNTLQRINRWLYLSENRCPSALRWSIRSLPFSPKSFGVIDEESTLASVQGLVALFALLVTQLALIYLLMLGKEIPAYAFGAYGLLGLITIVAMGTIVGTAKKSTEGAVMYAHERGTVTVGKWLMTCSLLLLLLFVTLGWARILPGVGAAELKVVHAGKYEDYFEKPKETTSPNGLPWITVDIPIRPDQFGGQIPTSVTILAESVKGWEPLRSQLFRITPDRWKDRILNYPIVDAGKTPAEIEVNVPVPDYNYVLELYLQPEGIDLQSLNKMEPADKAAKLSELELARDAAIETIKSTSAVRVSIKH